MRPTILILVALLLLGVALLYKQGNMNNDSMDASFGGSVPDATGNSGVSLEAFANAIYDFEDPSHNGLATKNNNPGNLKYAGQPAATGADARGFAVFPDFTSGFDALIAQLKLNLRRSPNQTLLQDRQHYLGQDPNAPAVPSGEGDPVAYATFVANKLGVSIYDTLGNLFGGNA